MKQIPILVWFKKNILNIIIFSVLAFLLSQRIPNWIDLWKLEGSKSHNFSAVVLRPAIENEGSRSPRKDENLPAELIDESKLKNTIFIPQELNKPAVLIFWATWCGPCQIELSRIRALVEEKKVNPQQIYLMSIAEDPELILTTAVERNYPFHLLHDMNGDAFQFYKVRATPTTVFVDQDGTISWIGTGLSPTLGLRMEKHINQ